LFSLHIHPIDLIIFFHFPFLNIITAKTEVHLKKFKWHKIDQMDTIINTAEYARNLIEASLDPLVTINADGKIMDVNGAMIKITDKEREKLIGTDFKDYFTDPEKAREVYQEVFAKGFVANYPLTITDGVLTEVLFNGSVFKNKEGKVLGAVVVARDISERRKSEIALQKSEARLKGIIASQSTYVLRTNFEGNYTYCNPKFINDFGWLYSKDNSTLIGMNGMVSIMPYHHEAVQDVVKKCFAKPNQVFQIEIDKPAKNNGIKTTLWDFILLTDQEGQPEEIQCAGIEITDRKKAEIKLQQINEQLQKQTKDLEISNAELEQFAYVASHDLQEPLRMITSFLTLLEKKYGNVIDDKGKKYIYFAVDGAKRMREIILDLLEFSKVGKTENELEYLNLNDVLKEVKLLLRKSIEEKSATISIDLLPEIRSHRVPLLQVFQNLISNALKYANKEIPVQINITVKEFNDRWLFAVIDNGIGIEKDYFEKIFILFQRLHNKDEYSGTGMGLAITKKIIGTLGGKIWVKSEIGKGSSFFFTIKKTNKNNIYESSRPPFSRR
jgi:PAS domain S-box-containing protein